MDAALHPHLPPHLPVHLPAQWPQVALSLPADDRFGRLLQALARALLRAAEARHRSRLLRAERRQHRLAQELSPALLRDIGAPDWLQQEAQAWRRAEGDRHQALRLLAAAGL